jgi:two-component system NtrC family sensor kinase
MDELRTAQQQLIQAAKLAAIGELAAGVAHELNSPLTVIVARCDLLVRKVTADSPAVPAVESIKAEAMRAALITRGLLDFSRKREPKHEPVNVNWLVPKALDLVQTKLHGLEIAVETELDTTLPAILGDGDQLIQVLINLIGNAADAMPGGGRITVKTETPSDRDCVAVSVSDTGTGMTGDQLARIFEPFYTTKAEGKGTGLGLSVTLGIVKSHRGTIAVESEPGCGTTMTVQLPLSSDRASAPVAVG